MKSLQKLIKLIFGRYTWQKVVVQVHCTDWIEFNELAWAMTDKLWDNCQPPLYFARYSWPNSTTMRVEIQVELNWTRNMFQDFFDQAELTSAVYVVSVEGVDGSIPHAQAYAFSRVMRGKGELQIRDALHWFFNMSGFSYAQEARMLAEQTAVMAGAIEKMEKGGL